VHYPTVADLLLEGAAAAAGEGGGGKGVKIEWLSQLLRQPVSGYRLLSLLRGGVTADCARLSIEYHLRVIILTHRTTD
jgi:hypothetical protein